MPKQTQLTLAEIDELLQRLVGLPINRTWRGYGSVVFFEIGELNNDKVGEFTFSADKNWALCLANEGCHACYDLELKEMNQLLEKFVGAKVIEIKLNENSLVIELDENKSIKIDNYKKDNWTLQLGDETWCTRYVRD